MNLKQKCIVKQVILFKEMSNRKLTVNRKPLMSLSVSNNFIWKVRKDVVRNCVCPEVFIVHLTLKTIFRNWVIFSLRGYPLARNVLYISVDLYVALKKRQCHVGVLAYIVSRGCNIICIWWFIAKKCWSNYSAKHLGIHDTDPDASLVFLSI